jgi:hypothetical protein
MSVSHDAAQRRVRLQSGRVDAHRLALDQPGVGLSLQHPGEHCLVRLEIDQAPRARDRRVIRRQPWSAIVRIELLAALRHTRRSRAGRGSDSVACRTDGRRCAAGPGSPPTSRPASRTAVVCPSPSTTVEYATSIMSSRKSTSHQRLARIPSGERCLRCWFFAGRERTKKANSCAHTVQPRQESRISFTTTTRECPSVAISRYSKSESAA